MGQTTATRQTRKFQTGLGDWERPKTERIVVPVTPNMKAQIEQAAIAEEVTVAEIVRRIIDAALDG